MNYRTALLLMLAVGVAVAPTVAAAAATNGITVERVIVRVYDGRFKLSQSTLAPGRVTFTVINRGRAIHNLDIVGVHQSPFLAPGTRKTFTITIKRGTFDYVCTVPDHDGYGEFGTLIVG
jgi:plastocyanin